MTILPVAPPITGLEFGGRVEIGKQSCSKGSLLTAEVYVGINAVDPIENYFYADIGALTFQSFFDAFCIDVSLPKPLGDSGFPKGLKTSFSLLGKQLPHAGISIPVGFRFKGAINILGLQASADVNISPVRFKLQVELPAINIAGILKMYKSSVEKSTGPFINVDIGIESVPSIEASGFIEVLGISAEAKLKISSSKTEYFVAGRFLGLLEASLRISSTYGSISNAGYEVEGHFKSDLFDRIAQGVRDVLQKSADEADKHLSAAQDKLDEAKAKLDSAINKFENAKKKVDDAKKVFDAAVSKVEDARNKLDSVCRIRSCSSKCIGCPSGWVCCKKKWGACICTHPGWDSCCTRITDPICTAANAGCWLLKKPLDLILQGVIFVVDKSRHVLDVAKIALIVAQGILHGVKVVLDGAILFLEGVKLTYKIGVYAITALAEFVLTKIINIREIYFRVALSVAKGGEFMCRIKGVLLGLNLDLDLKVNTRDITSVIKNIADRVISGLSNFIG
jgi:exonuclease VII small subunit